MYADTEDAFWAIWGRICDVFKDQPDILAYLEDQWLGMRYQWADCFIGNYCSFGQRTTSPTESANKQVKSYLTSGLSDLLTLVNVIQEMVVDKHHRYVEELALQQVRNRQDFHAKAIFYDCLGQLTYKAMKVALGQYNLATTALPRPGYPDPPGLRPCRQRTTGQ